MKTQTWGGFGGARSSHRSWGRVQDEGLHHLNHQCRQLTIIGPTSSPVITGNSTIPDRINHDIISAIEPTFQGANSSFHGQTCDLEACCHCQREATLPPLETSSLLAISTDSPSPSFMIIIIINHCPWTLPLLFIVYNYYPLPLLTILDHYHYW